MAMTGYPGTGAPYQPPAQNNTPIQPTQYGNDMLIPGTRQNVDGQTYIKMPDGSWQPMLKNANGQGWYTDQRDWSNPQEATERVKSGEAAKEDNTSALSASFTVGTPPVQPADKKQTPTFKGYVPRYMFGNNPWGREPTAQYKEDRANLRDKQAAQSDMIAQRLWQESNKDFRNEQTKNDQTQANTKFTESQQQMNGSDNTSLVGRELVSNDPTQREQWQLQQAEGAASQERNATAERDQAIQLRQKGAIDQYNYRQNALYNMGSDQLSLGPQREKDPEKEEKKKEETQTQEPPQPTSNNEWYGKASHQDVLNCAMKKYGKEVVQAYPDVPDTTGGRSWDEISRSKPANDGLEHTLYKQPDLDTPEYKQAVEELADKLWNGEQITVGGQTYGGKEKGVDNIYDLWKGRGGSKGYELAKKSDAEGGNWERTNKAEKEQMSTQNNIVNGVTGGFNSMYNPMQNPSSYSQSGVDQNQMFGQKLKL